jgi:hypothetical protein
MSKRGGAFKGGLSEPIKDQTLEKLFETTSDVVEALLSNSNLTENPSGTDTIGNSLDITTSSGLSTTAFVVTTYLEDGTEVVANLPQALNETTKMLFGQSFSASSYAAIMTTPPGSQLSIWASPNSTIEIVATHPELGESSVKFGPDSQNQLQITEHLSPAWRQELPSGFTPAGELLRLYQQSMFGGEPLKLGSASGADSVLALDTSQPTSLEQLGIFPASFEAVRGTEFSGGIPKLENLENYGMSVLDNGTVVESYILVEANAISAEIFGYALDPQVYADLINAPVGTRIQLLEGFNGYRSLIIDASHPVYGVYQVELGLLYEKSPYLVVFGEFGSPTWYATPVQRLTNLHLSDYENNPAPDGADSHPAANLDPFGFFEDNEALESPNNQPNNTSNFDNTISVNNSSSKPSGSSGLPVTQSDLDFAFSSQRTYGTVKGATTVIATNALALNSFSQNIFRQAFDFQDYATLVAAPDGATVYVSTKGVIPNGRIQIVVDHELYSSQVREFYINDKGKLEAHHDVWILKEEAPKGTGIKIFRKAINSYLHYGVEVITTEAAGYGQGIIETERRSGNFRSFGESVYNGYYTWAAFGFNAKLPDHVTYRLPENLKVATTLNELFLLDGGAEWWKKYGSGLGMVFDLDINSSSIKIFKNYLARKHKERSKEFESGKRHK